MRKEAIRAKKKETARNPATRKGAGEWCSARVAKDVREVPLICGSWHFFYRIAYKRRSVKWEQFNACADSKALINYYWKGYTTALICNVRFFENPARSKAVALPAVVNRLAHSDSKPATLDSEQPISPQQGSNEPES